MMTDGKMKLLAVVATIAAAGAFMNWPAEAQVAKGGATTTRVVSTRVSPPKLASTKVTEQRRVTTQVGRPKVVSEKTRIATNVAPLPATRSRAARAQPVVKAKSASVVAQKRAAPRTVASASPPQATAQAQPQNQAGSEGYQVWRDQSRMQFKTGDFFDRP